MAAPPPSLGQQLAAIVARAARTSTRVLGLDPGSRFVGLALSSPDLRLAIPHRAFDRAAPGAGAAPPNAHAAELRAVLAAQRVSSVVVGLPLDTLGREGEACAKVRRYVRQLKLGAQCPVVFLDERFTSAACRHALSRAGVGAAKQARTKDTAAASLLLQNALDIAHGQLRLGGGREGSSSSSVPPSSR